MEYPRNQNNVCFIHALAIKNWEEILKRQFERLMLSGLYGELDAIFLTIATSDPENFKVPTFISELQKVQYLLSGDVEQGERLALNWMHQFCVESTQDSNILYFHTKGVTKFGTYFQTNIEDWVNLMETFVIDDYRTCLDYLKTVDTCGINYLEEPVPHFSGNFWWAKGSYIKQLNPNIGEDYRDVEWWVLSGDNVKFCCLFHSQINHYLQSYSIDGMPEETEPTFFTKENNTIQSLSGDSHI